MNRSIILVVALLLLGFAPAPLSKRPRNEPPPSLPTTCVMRWHGTPYRTTFRADGSYSSRSPWGQNEWQGRWQLVGRKLIIVESLRPDSPDLWERHEVEMTADLRRGRILDGEQSWVIKIEVEP